MVTLALFSGAFPTALPTSFPALPVYSKVFSVPSAVFTTTVFVPSSIFVSVPLVTFKLSLPTLPISKPVSSTPLPVVRATLSVPSLRPSKPTFVPLYVVSPVTLMACSVPSALFTTTAFVALSTFVTVPWTTFTTSCATHTTAATIKHTAKRTNFVITILLSLNPALCPKKKTPVPRWHPSEQNEKHPHNITTSPNEGQQLHCSFDSRPSRHLPGIFHE